MSLLLTLAALAVSLVACARLARRERALTARVSALDERIVELSRRVDAAEADVGHAVTQTEIAESLLLEKGVADEDDIEEVRRRFVGGDAAPAPVDEVGRGSLH